MVRVPSTLLELLYAFSNLFMAIIKEMSINFPSHKNFEHGSLFILLTGFSKKYGKVATDKQNKVVKLYKGVKIY